MTDILGFFNALKNPHKNERLHSIASSLSMLTFDPIRGFEVGFLAQEGVMNR